MLFGNEENRAEKKKLRAEEALIAELHEKFKKSKWISCDVQANCETYHLDKIDVSFDISKAQLVVKNKMGIEIETINCKFDANSDAQQKRHVLFSGLLARARALNNQENQRQEKKRKGKRGKFIRLGSLKRLQKQRQEIQAIRQSVRKIKSL